MVIECASQERLVKDFAAEVSSIWEEWHSSLSGEVDSSSAEQSRKELLIDLRSRYQDRIDADVIAKIMRTEAAKYNNIRS